MSLRRSEFSISMMPTALLQASSSNTSTTPPSAIITGPMIACAPAGDRQNGVNRTSAWSNVLLGIA